MRNNNQQVIRRISTRSLKNSRMRNFFAITAIALTCMLFTVLASMGIGMLQVTQEETMREVGGRFHAGLKHVTQEQMEAITADGRVKDYSWNIFLGSAENLIKRSGEIRVPQGEQELKNSFIELEEGSLPKTAEEIIVDTITMDELHIPYKVGAKLPLEFQFFGQKIEKTFTVSGWYQGDPISRASQLYVSEAYWRELKEDKTDEDFVEWGKEHIGEESTGLFNVGLYFSDAGNIEDTIRDIIEDAGYEPEKDIDYGVNWAYMQNRAEGLDISAIVLLFVALIVVILTGYLIIYNIFQISIIQDIRFYGLMKTIGTTKKQIKKLVLRQVIALSAVGIPLGLMVGFLVSKVLFPFAMSFFDTGFTKITLHFHPLIVVFGAVFSLFTVWVSCRKPWMIAGSVSPVEAVHYSEGTVKRKKSKRSETGAKMYRMALSNLGRNKKKTLLVILSLSFSTVLLCVVVTGVESFRIDSYLESRLMGDVAIGSTRYTDGNFQNLDMRIDPEFVKEMDSQPGITARGEMWNAFYRSWLNLDDRAMERYEDFKTRGMLREENYGNTVVGEVMEKNLLRADIYGYDDCLLSRLSVKEGQLDIEKFQKGGYILLSSIVGVDTEDTLVYHPGDKVTISRVTENSISTEVKEENGETVDVEYSNLEEKEYQVMAIVDIPYSMDKHVYSVNGIQMVLPKEEMAANNLLNQCFAVSYWLDEEHLESFREAAQNYGENENRYMGYTSKENLEKEFKDMINVIRIIGVALSIVITLIGVLNFINSIFTGILSRRREFAILCSIGMTEGQMKKMLLQEGLYYVLISGSISILLGSGLSYLVLKAANEIIMCFSYRYNFTAFLIMIPMFALVSILAPWVAYRKMKQESIVERLRDTES